MRTETQLIDFFKVTFRDLSRKRKATFKDMKKVSKNHPLQVETATTYNIACEVLGADVAGQMPYLVAGARVGRQCLARCDPQAYPYLLSWRAWHVA